MRIRSGWIVAVVLAISGVALAQEPAPIDLYTPPPQPKQETPSEDRGPGGFELGARIDAELPLGDSFQGTSLQSMTSGQAGLRLDLGWRIDPRWEVGAFGRYGIAFVNGCTENVSCAAHEIRLGIEGQLHFRPGESFDPWVGLGAGYEWLSLSASTSAVRTDVTFQGPTFALVDVGGDFKMSDRFALGPYLEASAGQFRSTESGDLSNKRVHLWLGLGVRGWFDVR